jgi:hypothetical protein
MRTLWALAIAAILTACSRSENAGELLPAAASASDKASVTEFVYVADSGGQNVSGYAVDASSGALTPVAGSPFSAGTEPLGVAIDPTGRFAYVANSGSNNVSAYAITATTGVLTPVAGSPFPMARFRRSPGPRLQQGPVRSTLRWIPSRSSRTFLTMEMTRFQRTSSSPEVRWSR